MLEFLLIKSSEQNKLCFPRLINFKLVKLLPKTQGNVTICQQGDNSPRQYRYVPPVYKQFELVHICLIFLQAKILRYNRSYNYCESPNTNR